MHSLGDHRAAFLLSAPIHWAPTPDWLPLQAPEAALAVAQVSKTVCKHKTMQAEVKTSSPETLGWFFQPQSFLPVKCVCQKTFSSSLIP